MPRHLIVIGGGQGGLTAAIYARLKGWDVLLLEKSETVGGKAALVELRGYRLDPGPSIIILPRIYESVFRDAGRSMSDYLQFRKLNPISRVCVEGREAVDLPAGRADAERLIGEVAPVDRKAFAELMAKLDHVAPHIDKSVFAHSYDHPWQLLDPHLVAMALSIDVRKPYKQLIDQTFQSPLLRAFFYGFPSYGGQTYDSKAPGALMIPYLMLQEGVFYPEGGIAAIPLAFERLARELGVEVRTSAEVTGIALRQKKVTSVTLANGERIPTDAVISNIDRTSTRSWFGKEEQAPPSFSYFTLHWGLRRPVNGLAHHTLLIPTDFESGFELLYRQRKFPSPPIVYLNETTQTDTSTAPPGRSNLFAVITAPACENHIDWEAQLAEFKRATLDTIARCGIELDTDDVDFERIQTPKYFQEKHGNYRGSLYGVDERYRPFNGMFPHPNRDRDVSNLFYCGGSVQPGAGLPMVTLSGRFAAQLL